MALKAVIFDLGGTLLHYYDPAETDPRRPFRRVTMLGVHNVLQRAAGRGSAQPTPEAAQEAVDRQIGLTFRAALQELRGATVETPVRAGLADVGVTFSDAEWADARLAFYAAIDRIVSPRLGVRETLDGLRQAGYRLGLISNSFWAADIHDRHLDEHGLLEFLPQRLYSCDQPYGKPHPSIFRTMLELLGVGPGEAAYVGDRPDVDVAGAQKVGMRGVLIHSPYDHTPLDGVTPDAAIDELPALPDALAGW